METKSMLYLVSEFVPKGEIFGEWKQNLWKESVNEGWRVLFILSSGGHDVTVTL